MPRRILQGTVVSDSRDKTVTVKVESKVMHSLYKKYVKRSKKVSAHDPENEFKVGDRIEVVEVPPMSKTKCWHVLTDNFAKQIGLKGE